MRGGLVQVSLKPSMLHIYAKKLVLKDDYRLALIESHDQWKAQDIVEKLVLKSNYCLALIESRDQWKAQDIVEKMETRAYNAQQRKKKDLQDKKEGMLAFMHESKRVRLDHQCQLTMVKVENKIVLLLELLKSNRTQSEIQFLLS